MKPINDGGPAFTWPQNGLHENVPLEIYRSDDITPQDTWGTAQGKAASKSLITDFHADPGTWKRTPKKKETKAMSFGSLVDCLLLETDKFESRYTVSPYTDFRTKEAKEWRAAVEGDGIQIVTEDQLATANDACEAIRNHHDAAKYLDGARTQVAFRHETKHGISSKGLIDIVPLAEETLIDLKTCGQPSMESQYALRNHMMKWSYHIQAGAYLDGWNTVTGEERTRFKFIFCTQTPPHKVAVIDLPFAAVSFGAEIYQRGIERLADCLQLNEWPSMWDEEIELDLPEHAYL